MSRKRIIAVRVVPAVTLSLLLFFAFSFSAVFGLKNQNATDKIELARKDLSGIVWLSMLRKHGLVEESSYSDAADIESAVRFGPDVMVSVADSPAADQDEASIAVNPLNPDNLVAGSHDLFLRFVDAAYYYSFDGGDTWTHVHRLPGTEAKPNAGDPVVAFDSDGNAYYAYIWGNFGFLDISVAVSKSTDGGVTWGSPKVVFQDSPGWQAWDKEWIEVDNWPGSPSRNTIYLTATFFDLLFNGHIVFTRSTDGGSTWSKPFEVSDPSLGTTDQLSLIAPAPDGSVYVVWLDLHGDGFGGTDTVKVRRGDNGGASWGPIVTIQTITGLRNIGDSRAASNPAIIVAPKPPGTNPLDYNIYVAYAAIGLDNEPEIRLAVSTDKGNTWTVRKVFDNNQLQEFFPALASESNGTVHIVGGAWSSLRELYGVGWGFSTDGGTTWKGSIISDTAYSLPKLSGLPDYIIGDYFDVDIGNAGKIHPIWTARFTGPDNDIVTDNGP